MVDLIDRNQYWLTVHMIGSSSRVGGIGLTQSELASALDARGVNVVGSHVRPSGQRPAQVKELAGWSISADVVHGVRHIVPLVRRSCPSVLTVHDLFSMDRSREYGIAKRNLVPRLYERSIRTADWLVANSEHTRQALVDRYPEVADRTSTVRFAARSRVMAAVPVAPKQSLPAAYVLYVGDDLPRKRLSVLLHGVNALPNSSALCLAIVGSAARSRANLEIRAQLRRKRRLWELPFATDAELRWLYENALATCVPSEDEGFGLTAGESVALGTATLISSCGALVEATEGRGVIVGDDSWPDMLRTLEEQRRSSGIGPVRSWDDVAREMIRTYTDLIDAG